MPPDYLERSRHFAAIRDDARTRARLISRLRFVTFVAAVACGVWASRPAFDSTRFSVACGLLLVFVVLVVFHLRTTRRADWFDALVIVNELALARIEHRWNDLPAADAPLQLDVANHPYAVDLDLFGRASLFQWLGTPATAEGRARLASWLLFPNETSVVRARQLAAAELAPMDDWREQFAAHGVRAMKARRSAVDAFVVWAEERDRLAPAWIAALAIVLTAATWLSLVLYIAHVTTTQFWWIPLTLGVMLSLATGRQSHGAFERAGAGEDALLPYAALFAHASSQSFESPWLREIAQQLTAGGGSAPASMRALNRVVGFADLRQNSPLLYIPIQVLTLWDVHLFFVLDRWRRVAGPHMRGWVHAIAELEALAALASVRRDNPAWCLPELTDEAIITAEGLGHPLIAAERRVTNDVGVGPQGTLLLVTGSNMSGKSTLLRTIGLNVVLAQAGSVTCATRLSLPATDLQTSIRIQDSLDLGLSYFMAALTRLKGVVDAAEHPREGRVVLYLLDEILQGTNSAERSIAVRAVVRHLLDAGAIGAVSTHDLHLAEEEPLLSVGRRVHFMDTVTDDDAMHFDYMLRDGLATSRNALRLMKMIGIDTIVTD